jgi:hypothetical protein
MKTAKPPILNNKSPSAPSVFVPSALLREARRQKDLPVVDVPPICILDPDGDIVRRLKNSGRAKHFDPWPCYHTDLYTFSLGGEEVGILGCVVGAPFAVLVAEQLNKARRNVDARSFGHALLHSLRDRSRSVLWLLPDVPLSTYGGTAAGTAPRGRLPVSSPD